MRLNSIIQNKREQPKFLSVVPSPISIRTKLGALYFLDPAGSLKAKDIKEDSLEKIISYLKHGLEDTLLPDQLFHIVGHWVLNHFNVLNNKPLNEYRKSVIVHTYSSDVVAHLEKLYWNLRDFKFQCQIYDHPGHVYDDSYDLLENWKNFHLISLTHFNDQEYINVLYSIARQSNTLFRHKYPVIGIADPTQKKLQNNIHLDI